MILRTRAPVLLLLVLLACGASARDTALRVILTGLNATRAAVVAYDAKAQTASVASATSVEAGKLELDAWRAKRAPVVAAIEAAYHLLAAAAVLGTSLVDVVAAVTEAKRAWDALRGAP